MPQFPLLYPEVSSITPNIPLHSRPAVSRVQESGSLTGRTVRKPEPGPGAAPSVDRGWRPTGPGKKLEYDAPCCIAEGSEQFHARLRLIMALPTRYQISRSQKTTPTQTTHPLRPRPPSPCPLVYLRPAQFHLILPLPVGPAPYGPQGPLPPKSSALPP